MISATKIGRKNEKSKRKSKKIFVLFQQKKAVFLKKHHFLRKFSAKMFGITKILYIFATSK